MLITFDTSSRLFRRMFIGTTLAASFVCFGLAAYSWTGPTAAPPNSNVAAPINVSATSQIKSGALQVNGLRNLGSSQFDGDVGIGTAPSTGQRLYIRGGPYGVYADATYGQAIRGQTTGGGYAGYFAGGGTNAGGVYAVNSGGYYAFLGYPGSNWSVYANGPTYTGSYSRADGGFCIGGSCKTSWAPTCVTRSNTCYVAHGQYCVASCGSGEVMTGGGGRSAYDYNQQCSPYGNGFGCTHYAGGGYAYLYVDARCCY